MGHTYSDLLVHVVFSTKDRAPLINESLRDRLHEYMGGLANGEIGQTIRVGGTGDHIHGLLKLRTDISVAEAMRKWKSISSGWVNKLPDRRGAEPFAWQAGYGAFSVSRSQEPRIREYIEHQIEHHEKFDFKREFLSLLRKHHIEYDPTTIWD